MHTAYKYRLYASQKPTELLTEQLREACDLDDCALEERRNAWKAWRISITCDQANRLEQLKADGLMGLANYSCCGRLPSIS